MIFKFEIGLQIGTFSIAYKCNNILLSGLELCGKPESREKSKNRKKSDKIRKIGSDFLPSGPPAKCGTSILINMSHAHTYILEREGENILESIILPQQMNFWFCFVYQLGNQSPEIERHANPSFILPPSLEQWTYFLSL